MSLYESFVERKRVDYLTKCRFLLVGKCFFPIFVAKRIKKT